MTKLKFGWVAILVFLFIYSFTQIDLGLTLTRASWWQVIQKAFQQVGYFHRPLSMALYLLILVLLFGFYFLVLKRVERGKLGSRQIWLLILLAAGILWWSYNAFSYDLFNYIFDAKVVTFYHQSPYQYRALDFPGDPMLGFMHWTHRLYPYGPIWLAVSIPISFLGWGKLLPTMILFKSLAVASYLTAAWLIFKILVKTKPGRQGFGLAWFALSPLVIVETLVSAHHDLLMMSLALAGFWLLMKKKYLLAWVMLFLSIGIKFATGFLVPVFIWITWRQWQEKKIDWVKVWWASLLLMVLAFAAAVYRIKNVQPWYLLYPLPFAVLLNKKYLFWPITFFSFGLLLNYAPFLYLGNWNSPVPAINKGLLFGFLGLGIISGIMVKLKGWDEKNN